MTNDMPPAGSPPSGPPNGLLAAAAIAQEEPATEKPVAKPAVAPGQRSSIDRTYEEPHSIESYRASLAKMFPQDAPGAPNDCGVPLDALEIQGLFASMLTRLDACTKALAPFATKALLMANAKTNLLALGRPAEPEGGTWISNAQSIQCAAESNIFYSACDAFGRAAAEQLMVDSFTRIAKANEAVAEKEQHLDDGGKIH